jgi:hypothetical protein
VHRTVRWCTGQCPVRQADSGELAALGTSTAAYDYKSPDTVRCTTRHCPVTLANWLLSGLRRQRTTINQGTVRWCTGLSGEPTVGWANGRPHNSRATRGQSQRSEGGIGLSGVHRTVSGAPTALNHQRSASPKKERNPHRTVPGGAPDCPVRQATEGKNCLPEMLSTASICLGAIKGTPRRMEEHHQAFLKHC